MAPRTPASAQPATEEPVPDGTDETPAAPAIGAPDPDAADAADGEAGFFTWIRRLGLTRRSGWLGGVCGGIAERIGIDPLLVRGIAVVLAVVGAPVALLYAIAWFLLPDEFGTIHAQQLGRGRVTRALPGIAAVFLLSFLPLTQGFWYAGALYWGDLGWGGALGRIVWTGVLLIAVVVLVVVLARRASSEVRTTPATTDDRPDTVPEFPAEGAGSDPGAGVVVSAALAAAAPVHAAAAGPVAEPTEPLAPPADASAEELAAWKRSQDEWQRQRAAWTAEQRRGERERRQLESHARAVAAAEAARERARIRRITRPRASAGAVFLVLGVALVGGALAAFAAAQSPGTRGAEWMVGAGVATLVLGVGTVVLALLRRRSGALAFFAMLSLVALATAIVLPTDRTPAWWGVDTRAGGDYWQLGGSTSLYVPDWDAAGMLPPDRTPVVDLWQYGGYVWIDVGEGATVRVELVTDAAETWLTVEERISEGYRSASYRVADGRFVLTVGAGEPDLVVRLWAGGGASVHIGAQTLDDALVPLDPAPDERTQWDDDGGTIDLLNPEPEPTPTPDPGTTGGGAGNSAGTSRGGAVR